MHGAIWWQVMLFFRDHYGRDIFENNDQGPNSIYV